MTARPVKIEVGAGSVECNTDQFDCLTRQDVRTPWVSRHFHTRLRPLRVPLPQLVYNDDIPRTCFKRAIARWRRIRYSLLELPCSDFPSYLSESFDLESSRPRSSFVLSSTSYHRFSVKELSRGMRQLQSHRSLPGQSSHHIAGRASDRSQYCRPSFSRPLATLRRERMNPRSHIYFPSTLNNATSVARDLDD